MIDKKQPKMGAMFGNSEMQGLFDMPFAEIGNTENADIVVMGAPCVTPYASVGPYCADAPNAIRSAFGWPGVLDHYDFDLRGKMLGDKAKAVDWGNLPYSETDFASNRSSLCEHVTQVLSELAVPFVMGGDDSTPIPVMQAYENYGPITVLQLDAHIDWRDEVAGERLGLSSNMRRASEMGWVENIIQVGARGHGSARPQDFEDAVSWGVHFFPMIDVVELDLKKIIEAIPANSRVFINLDIDAMDPAIVPSVIGPAPGGLNYWQVVKLFTAVAQRAKIVGFDLAELMPANDVGGRGALVAARLLAVVMGLVARQRS